MNKTQQNILGGSIIFSVILVKLFVSWLMATDYFLHLPWLNVQIIFNLSNTIN